MRDKVCSFLRGRPHPLRIVPPLMANHRSGDEFGIAFRVGDVSFFACTASRGCPSSGLWDHRRPGAPRYLRRQPSPHQHHTNSPLLEPF